MNFFILPKNHGFGKDYWVLLEMLTYLCLPKAIRDQKSSLHKSISKKLAKSFSKGGYYQRKTSTTDSINDSKFTTSLSHLICSILLEAYLKGLNLDSLLE
jgi:hypothetical protein